MRPRRRHQFVCVLPPTLLTPSQYYHHYQCWQYHHHSCTCSRPTPLRRLYHLTPPADLRSGYVDLFLLHYPECWGDLCGGVAPAGTFPDSWRALEDLYEAGLARAIGEGGAGALIRAGVRKVGGRAWQASTSSGRVEEERAVCPLKCGTAMRRQRIHPNPPHRPCPADPKTRRV